MSENKLKVTFAPGCFDNFEGTEEELAELMAEISAVFEDEDALQSARPLTEEEEQELLHMLEMQALNNVRQ